MLLVCSRRAYPLTSPLSPWLQVYSTGVLSKVTSTLPTNILSSPLTDCSVGPIGRGVATQTQSAQVVRHQITAHSRLYIKEGTHTRREMPSPTPVGLPVPSVLRMGFPPCCPVDQVC